MDRKIIMGRFGMGILIIIFLTIIVLAINTIAEGYRVISGGAVMEIDAWSVCRNVDNDCGLDIFVPTNKSDEWTSFRTYYPSGCCVLTTCGECTKDLNCPVLYPDCENIMHCVDNYCCTEGEPVGDCPEQICVE